MGQFSLHKFTILNDGSKKIMRLSNRIIELRKKKMDVGLSLFCLGIESLKRVYQLAPEHVGFPSTPNIF